VQGILAVMAIVSILIMATALVITENNIALTDTSLSNHHQIFSKKTKNIHLRKTNGKTRNGYAFFMHISTGNR
jgi:hypothetical protein